MSSTADSKTGSGSLSNLLASFGNSVERTIVNFGDFCCFSAHAMRCALFKQYGRRDLQRLLPQFYLIGALSVPVILVTGMFVGMVLAIQAIEQFMSVGLADRMGVIVSLSVVRELGPVLAGVMLAGRVGGALAAELGTMNVTEQLDALRAMGSDPIHVLVAPRFLACLILTPLLTMYCSLMGVFGGWIISVPIFDLSNDNYWEYTEAAVEKWDLLNGVVKSFAFGAVLALVSCYKGFHSKAGAEGVGHACTESFVASFVVILILDFFIALGLKGIYETIWGFKTVF
jgi:phospholipid/cholesterol/gamma-HCH transport system permease protein